jgi:hypothetical protein
MGAFLRIGMLTGGGDGPGLNAAIRAVVKSAARLGWEVAGFKGGTILGAADKGRFAAKTGHGKQRALPVALIRKAQSTLKKLKVEALVCAGGAAAAADDRAGRRGDAGGHAGGRGAGRPLGGAARHVDRPAGDVRLGAGGLDPDLLAGAAADPGVRASAAVGG